MRFRAAQLLVLSIALIMSPVFGNKADIRAPFDNIVAAHGYALEEHTIITDDGYILKAFRIPGRAFIRDLLVPGPPVILAHGIIDSCDGWVVNDEDSPAFVLSDAGYDVWLFNSRGNKYSKNHITLDTSSEEYWDFSWEEVGVIDLPALTDYILQNTAY